MLNYQKGLIEKKLGKNELIPTTHNAEKKKKKGKVVLDIYGYPTTISSSHGYRVMHSQPVSVTLNVFSIPTPWYPSIL